MGLIFTVLASFISDRSILMIRLQVLADTSTQTVNFLTKDIEKTTSCAGMAELCTKTAKSKKGNGSMANLKAI